MTSTYTYLDYNASAPLKPVAAKAIAQALNWEGNPYSPHHLGRRVRNILEQERHQIARCLGALANQVIFTSGGTEANHLVLKGFSYNKLFIGQTEHDSIRKAQSNAIALPVDENGLLDWPICEALLKDVGPPFLVSVMLANNETGVIQDMNRLVTSVHAKGGWVHTDVAQAVGRIIVNFQELGVDALTLSSHKFGGPAGVGALIVRDKILLNPVLQGGGQEWGLRSGTPSVPLIAGFSAALQEALEELKTHSQNLEKAHRDMEQEIRSISNDVIVFGDKAPRLPNTTCLSMPGVPHEMQVIAFDLEGIGISSGSACSSGKIASSPVLTAMGFSQASTAIRVSSGWKTRPEDFQHFIQVWKKIYERELSNHA